MQYLFPAEAADIHREETEQDKTQFIRKPRVIVCGSCLSASRFVYLETKIEEGECIAPRQF
jgi:hypothetical protein